VITVAISANVTSPTTTRLTSGAPRSTRPAGPLLTALAGCVDPTPSDPVARERVCQRQWGLDPSPERYAAGRAISPLALG
jgi:hypothetical protein